MEIIKIPKRKIDYQRVIDFLSFAGWSVNETAVAVKGKILWYYFKGYNGQHNIFLGFSRNLDGIVVFVFFAPVERQKNKKLRSKNSYENSSNLCPLFLR